MGNGFGELFRITTWGESHGPAVGVVIDGVPAGTPVDIDAIAAELRRRRPGGALASERREEDQPEILSGVHAGVALGTPLAISIRNLDARPADYDTLGKLYRPGHADHTVEARYGVRDARGGGRASARETVARVAAGAIALAVLRREHPALELLGWVEQVGEIAAAVDSSAVTREAIEGSPVRCPDAAAAARMIDAIGRARSEGDSLGGVIRAVARGVPAGWGDPVFGKLKARLASALLSIPATCGLEIGAGFAGARLRGSEFNDPLARAAGGGVETRGGNSGGIQGGISNGAPIELRVAFHAPSTIRKPQRTVTVAGEETTFEGSGRHDPCVLPRAVPIVEAMVALVLVDVMLSRRAYPPAGQSHRVKEQ